MSAGHNMKEANATYGSFMSMLKISTIAVVIVTAVVIALIS